MGYRASSFLWRGICILLMALAAVFETAAVPQGITEYEHRPEAPAMAMHDITGAPQAIAELKGKVVILNFWATWCAPCKEEMPALEKLYDTHRATGLALLGIAVGDSEADVRTYQSQTSIGFPMLVDESQQVSGDWQVIAVPTTYVLDRQGRIALRVVGIIDWSGAQIAGLIEGLLAEAQ